MYWRVRKIGPEQIARMYGVHAILIVSVIFNIFLFTRVNASKAAVPAAVKTDFDKFARQVTCHLFDANYMTVQESMMALNTELTKGAYKQMVQIGLIPPTADEIRAVARQMDESKSVSCVKFDEVKVADPVPGQALMVDCAVRVVVHDSQGVRPSAFKIRYGMGTVMDNKTKQATGQAVLSVQIQEINPGAGQAVQQ